MSDLLTDELIRLERSLHSGQSRRNAADLLSDGFREFGASGRVWDRAAMLAELATETPAEIDSNDFTCQQLTPGLALLTYTAATPTRRTLRSSLWRLEGNRWRLVFHQGTVIPPA